MKKKSFFSGFNAKMALAIVALSGALLTGCYKDDGLDVNGPAGEVILPNATYTITGSVVNPNGELIANGDATMTIGGASVELNGGSFTYQTETTGPVAIVVTPKNTKVYKGTVTTTVDIQEVAAGQAAVYNKTIVLPFADVVPTEFIDVEYKLETSVYGSDNLTNAWNNEDYTVKVNNANVKETYDGGTILNVVITPNGDKASKYGNYTTVITLPKYQVEKGENNIVSMPLTAILPYIEGPAQEYVYKNFNANFILINGAEVTSIELKKSEGTTPIVLDGKFKVEGINYFSYTDELKKEDANKYTYKIEVNYKDQKGASHTKEYDCNADNNVVADLLDGFVPADDTWNGSLYQIDFGNSGDEANMAPGVYPYYKDINVPADVNVVINRLSKNEIADLTVLRMYRGTPDGIKFAKDGSAADITVSFNEFGTEDFGEVTLVNANLDKADGSISATDGAYVLTIPHFSTFGAKIDFSSEESGTPTEKKEKTEREIGKKNDTDYAVNATIRYYYNTGSKFDIDEAVKDFTNDKAKERAKALILNDLASKNIVNNWEEKKTAEFIYTVAPYTCLESATIEALTKVTTYKYKIGSKEVTLDVTTAVKTEVKDVKTFTFGHGHGHSHDHGHGDLNADGGIIEAE